VYSCFGILNISFLPFRHPIDLLMEDEIAGEAHSFTARYNQASRWYPYLTDFRDTRSA
jgi:hypothetical protein